MLIKLVRSPSKRLNSDDTPKSALCLECHPTSFLLLVFFFFLHHACFLFVCIKYLDDIQFCALCNRAMQRAQQTDHYLVSFKS